MGNPRPRPKRLAGKLLQIRSALGLSQSEMLRRLETDEKILYTRISDYELDKKEPSLRTLLAYARAAGIHVEDLIDDELELPAKLPGNITHRGLGRKSTSRKR